MEEITLTTERLGKLIKDASTNAMEFECLIRQRINNKPQENADKLIREAISEIVGNRFVDKIILELSIS